RPAWALTWRRKAISDREGRRVRADAPPPTRPHIARSGSIVGTMAYRLHRPYQPRGDQPEAIAQLLDGLRDGQRYQTLLGVTGSGKTFSIANVIADWGKPVLALPHNKALAAQPHGDLPQFLPQVSVRYLLSP